MVKSSVMEANLVTLRAMPTHRRRVDESEMVIHMYESRTILLFSSAHLMLERWATFKGFYKADKSYKNYLERHAAKLNPIEPKTQAQSKGVKLSKARAAGINELQHMEVPAERDELKQKVIDLYANMQIRNKTEAKKLITDLQVLSYGMVKNNGEELRVTSDRTGPIREKRGMRKVEQFSKVPEYNKEAERAARQKKKEETNKWLEEERRKRAPLPGEQVKETGRKDLILVFGGYFENSPRTTSNTQIAC